MKARIICATLMLGGVLWVAPSDPAETQTAAGQERVQLIMAMPRRVVSFRQSLGRGPYGAIWSQAGVATVQILPLTKTEVWSVPRQRADAVKQAAARHGVVVHQVGERWDLFASPPAGAEMNDKQKSIIEQAKASSATVGVRMMATAAAPMVEYAMTRDRSAAAAKMSVTLGGSTVITITPTRVDKKPEVAILRGTVDGTGAPATLMWWPDGKMAGTVQHEGRIYSFRHMGGALHAMVEMSEDRMPREHAPMPPAMRSNDPNLRDDPLVQQGDASTLRPKAGPSPGSPLPRDKTGPSTKKRGGTSPADIVIDVIVAYTSKVTSRYVDVQRELIGLSIEEANESFRVSDLGHIKLRLVHAYQTGYVEQGEHFNHVWRFADKGDGHMDEVHGLRDKYRADIAVLLVDDATGCGLATRVHADANEAFAVVHHECAAITYSLAHEIGHLIGARHDLNVDKIMTPFPYGHGYVNGTKWRDIMSYKESCGGCRRLPIWSGPKVMVGGEPAGAPELDNARVIAEQARRVAGFR